MGHLPTLRRVVGMDLASPVAYSPCQKSHRHTGACFRSATDQIPSENRSINLFLTAVSSACMDSLPPKWRIATVAMQVNDIHDQVVYAPIGPNDIHEINVRAATRL